MIQNIIIPMPTPMPISHSGGGDDPRIITAVMLSMLIFFALLWLGGYVCRKATNSEDNLAEAFGKFGFMIISGISVVLLMACLIVQYI